MARFCRYELTDERFERMEEALPEVDGGGRPYENHRNVVKGICWVSHSGALWRDPPKCHASWKLEDSVRSASLMGHPKERRQTATRREGS